MLILLACFGLAGTIWLPIVGMWLYQRGWRWSQPLQISFQDKLKGLASLYLILPLVMTGFALQDVLTFADAGVVFRPQDALWLAMGLGAGSLGLAIAFGLEIALGWTQWKSPQQFLPAIALALVLGLWVGLVEEWLFRGFTPTALASFGQVGAIALSNGLFALLHLIWEPSDRLKPAMTQLPGLWLMGLVLAYARTVGEGSIALPWGLHAGWVCGLTALDTSDAIAYTGRVPQWLTGLHNQPLAGFMGWMLLGGTAAAMHLVSELH